MILTRSISTTGPRLLALTAAAWLAAVGGYAALVEPNTSFNPGVPVGPGTTIIATGSLFGTVLADQTIAFAESNPNNHPAGPAFVGTLRSLVVQRADTSKLDFYYQIANTTLSEQFPNDADIFAFNVYNFGGFGFANDALDMVFRTDGLSGLSLAGTFVNGTIGANTGNRDPMEPGSVGFFLASNPGFPFDDPNNLAKGETSNFFVVRSNATSYANSPSLISGFGTAVTQAYAPVPEPGVAGLAALGALGLGARRRRAVR